LKKIALSIRVTINLELNLVIKIDFNKLPQHIAIIMDGNGRWAKQHAIGRIRGHKKGAQSVRTTVKTCREIGIKYLTLFAFSIENWERAGKRSGIFDVFTGRIFDQRNKTTAKNMESGSRLSVK